MLKLKNIIWLAALVVTISSCDDYLDTPPVDKITSDGFYQTQAQSEQGILGIYADLRQASNCMYWFMSECRSDVAWVEPNPDAFREYSEIGTFRATDDMAMFNDTWNMVQHTIELMKNKNQLQQKVVEFIKNADLDMDNFEYVDMDKIQLKTGEGDEKPDEKVLDIPENIMDQIRLVSTYKGVHVPSMMFDSTGTKKIAAIASYVIEALEQGRILVVDELDSSIHFKLTRAIVAMFNNELNTSAQMIFTVHDINLMDCKRMFRKEQIWFVHKDEEGVYVYSLADFTAQQGVRDTTDVMEKYRKGALGALPDPELINSLLSIKSGVKGDDADAK